MTLYVFCPKANTLKAKKKVPQNEQSRLIPVPLMSGGPHEIR
jgi:hypothetical protein